MMADLLFQSPEYLFCPCWDTVDFGEEMERYQKQVLISNDTHDAPFVESVV